MNVNSIPYINRRWLAFSLFVILVLVLSACQGATTTQAPALAAAAQNTAAPPAASTSAPTEMSTEAPSAEPTISVANNPTLGSILVGDNGMTLYIFTKDAPNKSNCDASCLQKWPPLLTQGSPQLGEGVDASLIGTTDLADGSKIVTYNQMPLYYFAKDKQAGDTTGQGVGSVWFVVSPSGEAIQK